MRVIPLVPWAFVVAAAATPLSGQQVVVFVVERDVYETARDDFESCREDLSTCTAAALALSGTYTDIKTYVGERRRILSNIPDDTPEPFLHEDAFIVVRVFDKDSSLTMRQAGMGRMELRVDGDLLIQKPLDDAFADLRWWAVSGGAAGNEIEHIGHGDPAAITIATKAADQTFNVGVSNLAQPYGLLGMHRGFWTPIGLFGTNFEQSPAGDGIRFTAAPINVGLGMKWAWPWHDGAYIGTSFIGGWAVSSDDAGATLHTLSSGALFDLNGFGYVGAMHVFDFADGAEDPGWMAMIGFAPDFLRILAQ